MNGSLHASPPAVRTFWERYPGIRPALDAGDFVSGGWMPSDPACYGRREEIAVYRMPGSRSTVRFHIQTCQRGTTIRWLAFGEWCEYGRTAHDACYDFLDGGGHFATRATAEWAIHLYVARLLAEEATTPAVRAA